MTEERRAVPAKKAAKAAAFLLPFAVMILVISAFGIRYHTNDDATLANIAAGGYGDTLHMVYVNMLFSLLLRPLYALKRANWYVIVQLALVCLSLAAAGLVLVKRCGALRGTALAAGLTLPFAVHLFYYFQYTKNAAVMSAAGLLLIARDLGTMGGATWAGIVLALAGSLVRFESFALAGALFAAPLLLEFFRLDGNGKKKAAGAVIVLLALVFARKGADRAFYRKDEGWRRFRQYNRARTRFSDHKVYLLGEENSLGGAGVSDTDYTMLKNWDFFDREHFTSEYLDRISSEIEYPSYADSLKSLPGRLKEPAVTSYGLGAAAALLLALVLSLIHKKGRPAALICETAVFVLVTGYLVMTQRMPSWVECSLAFCLAAALFALTLPAEDEKGPAAPALMMLAACLLISLSSVSGLSAESGAYRYWAELEQGYFEDMASHRENLYLLSTESINVAAGLDVWHPRTDGFYSNIVAFGGWLSNAPHRKRALERYGLERPVVDGIGRDNVYFDYHDIRGVTAYASRQTGEDVEAVRTGDNAFAPYQLKFKQ